MSRINDVWGLPEFVRKDNSNNKRLHIQFNHSGIVDFTRCNSGGQSNYKTLLDVVWKQFGVVTDVFYHQGFSSCFLSFRTHNEAAAAMAALNDEVHLQAAIGFVLSKFQSDEHIREKAVVESLFVKRNESSLFASCSLSSLFLTVAPISRLI